MVKNLLFCIISDKLVVRYELLCLFFFCRCRMSYEIKWYYILFYFVSGILIVSLVVIIFCFSICIIYVVRKVVRICNILFSVSLSDYEIKYFL